MRKLIVPPFFLLISLALSCTPMINNQAVEDYSGLLPPDQMIYLSMTAFPTGTELGTPFPYAEIIKAVFPGQSQFIWNEITNRLLRVQLSLSGKGETRLISQISFPRSLFNSFIDRNTWREIEGLDAAFTNKETSYSFGMPADNTLFYLQTTQPKPLPETETAMKEWYRNWSEARIRNQLPASFKNLQAQYPIVFHSPNPKDLLNYRPFKEMMPILIAAMKISPNLPVRELNAWIGVRDPGNADGSPYFLEVELETETEDAAEGFAVVLKMLLPNLLLNAEEEVLRNQFKTFTLDRRGKFLTLELFLNSKLIISTASLIAPPSKK